MESKLSDFLLDKMSMTEIYQPVIIKELLNNNGKRTKTDLAVALARYDLSILEYYKKIVMRWPKDTLTKHGVIRYEKNSETFLLNSNFVDLDNSNKEIEICEKKIASWIYKKNNIERSPQVNTSIRYRMGNVNCVEFQNHFVLLILIILFLSHLKIKMERLKKTGY